MIPEAAQSFADRIEGLFGARCHGVVLAGSFARDDYHATSDLDLLVLLEGLVGEDLTKVSRVVRDIPSANELNPAVVSVTEFARYPDLFDFLTYKYEGIVLRGRLPRVDCPETELDRARRFAQEVLMSVRHYVAVDEPYEKLCSGKLYTYVQKPLSYALRFYHYTVKGRYIKPYSELASLYPVLSIDGTEKPHQLLDEAMSWSLSILGFGPGSGM